MCIGRVLCGTSRLVVDVYKRQEENHDLQAARLFPLCGNVEDLGLAMRWMTTEPELEDGRKVWFSARKIDVYKRQILYFL